MVNFVIIKTKSIVYRLLAIYLILSIEMGIHYSSVFLMPSLMFQGDKLEQCEFINIV